jgi:hypothetical protein
MGIEWPAFLSEKPDSGLMDACVFRFVACESRELLSCHHPANVRSKSWGKKS